VSQPSASSGDEKPSATEKGDQSPHPAATGRNSNVASRDQPQFQSVFASTHDRYLRNREIDAKATWWEWLRQRYAKYWYGIGCLAFDILLLGTILGSGEYAVQAWQYALALVFGVALVFVEVKGFLWFWPPGSTE
jgi:hypothetical protein